MGLDGAIALLEEIERHLLLLETLSPAAVAAEIDAIGAASRRVSSYLDDLAQGEGPVTLKLYERVNHVTLLASLAKPLDWLAPVRAEVLAFLGLPGGS